MTVPHPNPLVCYSQQGFTFIAVYGGHLAEVVTDHPRVLTVPAVVHSNVLFNAVRQGSLISCALHIIHVDRAFALPKICHCPCSSWTSGNRAYIFLIKHYSTFYSTEIFQRVSCKMKTLRFYSKSCHRFT